EECTEGVRRIFALLVEMDPILAHWYELGRSHKDSMKRKVDTLDDRKLRRLLLNGRNRYDIGRKVIKDLGFSLSLWNGADEAEAASIRFHCGCYSKYVGNNVIIDLPYSPPGQRWVEKAGALLALVAETWRPNWAGIMSKQAIRERDYDADRPFV